MRIKNTFVILITAFITLVLVQNTDKVGFTFLWLNFTISKLVMMTGISVAAFILGVLVGRPKNVKQFGEENSYHHKNLSDEDQDYIN